MKILRAQLLHNFCAKNGAHAQFLHNFSEPPATHAGSVLRTISAQFSQPGAIFLKSAAVQDRDVSNLELPWSWDAEDVGNCPKSESSRKWLGEGAQGLLDPASKRPLALVRNGVALVQNRAWVVQTTLRRPLLPGPKRALP